MDNVDSCDILHQLIGCFSLSLLGFTYPRWCRISPIHGLHLSFLLGNSHQKRGQLKIQPKAIFYEYTIHLWPTPKHEPSWTMSICGATTQTIPIASPLPRQERSFTDLELLFSLVWHSSGLSWWSGHGGSGDQWITLDENGIEWYMLIPASGW